MKDISIKEFALFSILLAIEAIFCFTPLGSLPAIGPIVATLSCLPVIVTALVLGWKAGMLMGFFFGLFSFIVWTFVPPIPAMAFIFTPFYSLGEFNGSICSILICFVPRILIGLTTHLINKLTHNYAFSSICGSLTNTLFVLCGISIFFTNQYEQVYGKEILYIFAITLITSGLPEAIVAALVCPPTANFIKKEKEN